MKSILFSLKEWIKEYPYISVLSLIAVISIAINIIFVVMYPAPVSAPDVAISSQKDITHHKKRSVEVESPYGISNEIYTRYENGVWKSSSSTAALTEEDVQKMKEDFLEHQQAFYEYFKKHDELMKVYWEKLW